MPNDGVVRKFFDQYANRNVYCDIFSWLLYLVANALDQNWNDLKIIKNISWIPVQFPQEANQSFQCDGRPFVEGEVLCFRRQLITVDVVVEELNDHVDKDERVYFVYHRVRQLLVLHYVYQAEVLRDPFEEIILFTLHLFVLFWGTRQSFVAHNCAPEKFNEGMTFAPSAHLADENLFFTSVKAELGRSDSVLGKHLLWWLLLIVPGGYDGGHDKINV